MRIEQTLEMSVQLGISRTFGGGDDSVSVDLKIEPEFPIKDDHRGRIELS